MTRLELDQVWENRDLINLLAWREIKLRYKQTIIGAAWAIIQPLVTMVVFTVLFGKLMKVSSEGIPYPIFAYSALVPWTFFVHALTKSTHSLVSHQDIITKVYFPRLVIPIAAVLAAFIDFIIAFAILILMMFFYGMAPGISILSLPVFILLTIATALGVGLWLAVLNVQYRDVANALSFITQIWLFITPVAYSSGMIPKNWQFLYGLNPMVGVVEGFRWALTGSSNPLGPTFFVSLITAVATLAGGIYYFRQREDSFADVV